MINHVKKRIIFFSFFLIILSGNFYASIIIKSPDKMNMPSKREFVINREFIRPFSKKKITVAEYLTDPLIMYVSLWACFGITTPLWETRPTIISGPNAENMFGDRLKMEPFASGRIDPVTKPATDINGNPIYVNGHPLIILRNDFYAKNFIEPAFFTYLALYMRSKDYHPAIMITEIILLSLLYEFTIRPFFMNSSFEQFLKNPSVGIVFSILFDELSTFLLTTPYIGLHVLAYIFNPFNALPNARVHPMLFFDPYRKTASIEALIKF